MRSRSPKPLPPSPKLGSPALNSNMKAALEQLTLWAGRSSAHRPPEQRGRSIVSRLIETDEQLLEMESEPPSEPEPAVRVETERGGSTRGGRGRGRGSRSGSQGSWVFTRPTIER